MKELYWTSTPSAQSSIDPTQIVGKFLPWFEMIGIAGIIFVVFQFMEAVKTRNYLFRLGVLKKVTACLIGIPILLVMFATFLSFVPGKTYSILEFPSTYEITALFLLSILLLLYVLFLWQPRLFLPRYSSKLLRQLGFELMRKTDEDSLSALSIFIEEYIDEVISRASRVRSHHWANELENDKLALEALEFIDVQMSTRNFIRDIAQNNISLIGNFIKLSEEYRLWDSRGGHIFFNNLCKELFTNENSLLTRELDLSGVEGVYKPISKVLFKSPEIISHYRIFQSFQHWGTGVSEVTLQNWTNGLKVAIKDYYSKERSIYYADTPNVALAVASEHLSDSFHYLCVDIHKQGDEVWNNPHKSKMHIISNFFQGLEGIFLPDTQYDDYRPAFSREEKTCKENTVSEGIAVSLFKYLESLAIVKHEEYARTKALEIYWILLSNKNIPIINAIQKKLLELIKERVEKNISGGYASMIKLLINIYRPKRYKRTRGIIENYFKKKFQRDIALLFFSNRKFREEHLVNDWKVLVKKGAIVDSRGEFVYKKRQ